MYTVNFVYVECKRKKKLQSEFSEKRLNFIELPKLYENDFISRLEWHERR